MCLFRYARWTFKPQENSRERNIITRIYKLLLPFRKCYLAFFRTQNDRDFYLSENNRNYFPHITKIWSKYSSFSSHFYS